MANLRWVHLGIDDRFSGGGATMDDSTALVLMRQVRRLHGGAGWVCWIEVSLTTAERHDVFMEPWRNSDAAMDEHGLGWASRRRRENIA
ncbi:hypothetical protein M0R45_032014 [Rubus argutus]|uniref:Uncharacterized protein n=1 Tax=Rubus argutus TaxID=59490 RepID=A0AAW1WHW0_RUBAR